MLHYWSLDNLELDGSWLTVGSFDGVHLGHRAILEQLICEAHAAQAQAVVLTFHPHPAVVLGKRDGPFYLSSPEDKAAIMASLGLDGLISHPFNRQTAAQSARDFIQHMHRHLGFRWLWVGNDFALGRQREGDLPILRGLGDEFGYQVRVVEPVNLDAEVISSSRVRNTLAQGDVRKVERLLGRPYRVEGEVVHGDGRGKALGFPTANLEVWTMQMLPKPGVYVGQARVGGVDIPAVTNVGFRPTFETQSPRARVETHLLDFDQDLYQSKISLSFEAHLRDEQRFTNIQALIDQVQRDIRQTRSIFNGRHNLEAIGDETISGASSAHS